MRSSARRFRSVPRRCGVGAFAVCCGPIGPSTAAAGGLPLRGAPPAPPFRASAARPSGAVTAPRGKSPPARCLGLSPPGRARRCGGGRPPLSRLLCPACGPGKRRARAVGPRGRPARRCALPAGVVGLGLLRSAPAPSPALSGSPHPPGGLRAAAAPPSGAWPCSSLPGAAAALRAALDGCAAPGRKGQALRLPGGPPGQVGDGAATGRARPPPPMGGFPAQGGT